MLSTLLGEASSPLFNRTGLLLRERWQRQTARFPLAWPPPADVLPSEPSSPGTWASGSSPSGRRTAAARRVVSSSRREEAAAIRLPARAPAHVYPKERSQCSCQAGACHRWVPHLGAGGGRNPSPSARTYICIIRLPPFLSDSGWRCESGSPPRRRLAGGQRGGRGTGRNAGGAGWCTW